MKHRTIMRVAAVLLTAVLLVSGAAAQGGDDPPLTSHPSRNASAGRPNPAARQRHLPIVRDKTGEPSHLSSFDEAWELYRLEISQEGKAPRQIPSADVWLSKMGEGNPVSGRTYDWEIRYANWGDLTAEDVVIVDTLSPGMTYVSDSLDIGVVVGDQVIFELGTLAPVTAGKIILTVQVDAESCTDVSNCAEISTTSWEWDTGNNGSCDGRHVEADEVDLWVNKWADPWEPVPGHEYIYHIDYGNNRGASALDVIISDRLPAGTTFVSEWHPPGWSVDTSTPGVLVWMMPEMPSDHGWYLELKLRVNDDTPPDTQLWNRVEIATSSNDVDPDNDWHEHDMVTGWPWMDMRVYKGYDYGSYSSPVAGQEYTYWVEVQNEGTVIAHDVVLTDILPDDSTFVGAMRWDWNPTTGDYDLHSNFPPDAQGSSWVRWDLGELVSWRDIPMQVTIRINDDVPVGTEMINRVEVSSREAEGDPDDNVAEYAFTTQAPGPNLRVEKWRDWGDACAGCEIGYGVQIGNDGTETASDVVLTDILPDSVEFQWHDFHQDPEVSDNTLIWHLGDMRPGESHGMQLCVRIPDDTPAGTELVNRVEATTSSTETRTDDNAAEHRLVVGPDLRVGKEVLDEVMPGFGFRYRIRVWNEGDAEAHNVVLIDTLPAGTEYEWDEWGAEVEDGQVVWHLGNLHSGWSDEFEMGVNVLSDVPSGTVITNTLNIISDEGDANPDDNHFELASTVESPYRIQVQESHNWVNGRVLPHAYVNVTLKDSGGLEKETVHTDADDGGYFWAPFDEDITPGDTVEVDTEGTFIVIEVIRIEGTVDAATNTISGHVYDIAYPADVRGEVWVEDGPSVEGQTDEFGDYTVDFSPFDVKSGHWVALWHVRPDGHEVGIVRSALRLFVTQMPNNGVEGETMPGATVNLSVYDVEDMLKGTAETTADDSGYFYVDFDASQPPVDIQGGDRIEALADGQSVILSVPLLLPLVDAVHDFVAIRSDLPHTELRIDLRGDYWGWITTDGDGSAIVDFSEEGIALGDDASVAYFSPDSHEHWAHNRAMINIVVPDEFVSDQEQQIIIGGAGFQPAPETVLLGEWGAPPSVVLMDVTYLSDALLQVTVPAGTPTGIYYMQIPNPDGHIGFLAEALTIMGAPSIGTFEPDGGSGRVSEWVDFTTTYSDPDGYEDIQLAFFFLDREPPIASGGLAAAYYQPADLLLLLGGGSCRPSQATSLSTDYVTLDCRHSSVSGEDDTLTINWVVRPLQCFDGGCGVNRAYEFVMDSAGLSDFGAVGTWTLNPASGPAGDTGPAVQPTEADGSTELAEVLERLREEIEAWQSQLGEPY